MFESDPRRPRPAPGRHRPPAGSRTTSPRVARAATRPGRTSPTHQWDDWRWQTQNSIRSVRQLRTPAPLHPRRARSHRPARRRVQARHPAVLLLAHRPGRPGRPDPPPVGALAARGREPVGVRTGRPARRGQGLAGPRADPPLPGPRAADHHAQLLDVLPVLHPQAGHADPRRVGGRQRRRRADDRLRPHAPRDPGRDRVRRRPADAAARQAPVLPGQPEGDHARRRDPHRHPRARSRCRSGSTTPN